LPQPIVWPLGLAFYVGLKRLVSRPYELDCDRRAARAIGYRETIGALAKIHAVHPIRSSGLVSLLVYATATHPSREIRLAALRDAAPETERPAIELSESRIRWQRRATLAAFVIWLVTISTTVAVSVGKLPAGFLPIPLWIVGLAPLVLIHLAQRKRLALNRKRLGKRVERIFTLVFVVIVAALVLPQLSNALIEPLHVPGPQLLQPATSLLLIVGSLGFIIWLAWTNRRRELRKAVAIALQVHDFRRILELARRSPRDVSRDHILRYNVALARAVCDDRPAAIAMLDGLWQDKPGFPLTGFALGQILLDTGQPEQALAVAEALVRKLPRDAGTHALAARVRRRLRQLDEAQSACDRVLALEPEDGPGYGIAAGLALDRGEPTRAQELITRALDYSPGDTHLLIIRAEVAIQTKPLDEARALVAEAIAAVRSNPMVLLKTDVTGLEQKLAAREMREASSQPVLAASDSAATG
jgi:Flp pilus assembly protein TadD